MPQYIVYIVKYIQALNQELLDHWRIHVEDGVTSNWACSEQLVTSLKMRHNRELRWECVDFQWDEPYTNHNNISYLLLYIWSWYSYEIKIHMKSIYCGIYCHKFETKLLLMITNTIYENWAVQSSFTWRSVEGIVMFTHSLPWMGQS